MMTTNPPHQKQSGNILFLILIAVALLAGLTYAVTQSTRSGSDTGQREQARIGSAVLTQYPTALRTAVLRMIVAGTDIQDILFNAPNDMAGLSAHLLVFAAEGGSATFQESPADVMAAASSANWSYNAEFYIPSIGRDGSGGNDLIAFLAGVNAATCLDVNQKSGIGDETSGQCGAYNNGIPSVSFDNNAITATMTDGYEFPTGLTEELTCTGGNENAFAGKERGCFYDTDLNGGQFVYYHVIIQR